MNDDQYMELVIRLDALGNLLFGVRYAEQVKAFKANLEATEQYRQSLADSAKEKT